MTGWRKCRPANQSQFGKHVQTDLNCPVVLTKLEHHVCHVGGYPPRQWRNFRQALRVPSFRWRLERQHHLDHLYTALITGTVTLWEHVHQTREPVKEHQRRH